MQQSSSFEGWDTILVHVNTFKGHHKIQDRWENREYVVEKQPYHNVPVYMVCLRDGEGCSWTLYSNYLLSISPNIEQDVKDEPVAAVEDNNASTPVTPVDSEAADAGLSGMVTLSAAGSTLQGSLDWLAPLRCSVQKTWNWLPWRYQNVGLQADTSPSDICVDWSVYLLLCHILSVYHFLEEYSVNNTVLVSSCVCQVLLSFSIEGNSSNAISVVDLWMVGMWVRGYLTQVQLPYHGDQSQNSVPIET